MCCARSQWNGPWAVCAAIPSFGIHRWAVGVWPCGGARSVTLQLRGTMGTGSWCVWGHGFGRSNSERVYCRGFSRADVYGTHCLPVSMFISPESMVLTRCGAVAPSFCSNLLSAVCRTHTDPTTVTASGGQQEPSDARWALVIPRSALSGPRKCWTLVGPPPPPPCPPPVLEPC